MDVDNQSSTEHKTRPKLSPFHTEFYDGAAQILETIGQTFLDVFNEDEYTDKQKKLLYYPFASQQEWELASFLLKSDLSMAAIDDFLKLQLISHVYYPTTLCIFNSGS